MQSNHDLNSNLIKSLTSVHLPPPPSSHNNQPSMRQFTQQSTGVIPVNHHALGHQQHLVQQYAASQGQQGYVTNDIFTNKIPFQQELTVSLDGYQHNQYLNVQPQSGTKVLESPNEEAMPLNTPPHTVSRQYSAPVYKTRIQETPTLNQSRIMKNNKGPLSPQYSSPSSSSQDSVPKKVNKPPQPFFTPKVSKSRKFKRDSRELKDPLPIQKAHSSKEKEKEKEKEKAKEPEEIPSPRKLPKIVYDSDSKPPYSYATLIGMAILRGEDRKLTLSQIYAWISTTFRYYRKNDVGWQNSIRHNLSLNKAFIKTEKSSDGKGHYWEIVKGHEMQFIRGKTGKRSVFSGVQLEQSTIPLVKPNQKEISSVSEPSNIVSSEEDLSEDDKEDEPVSKTPKRQLGSAVDEASGEQLGPRASLEEFTLPKIAYTDYDDGELTEDDKESKLPRKRQQLRSVSETDVVSLNIIPSLQAPDTNWAASASGEHIIFGQIKPSSVYLNHQSPTRATRVSSLTSFSCNTNVDVSPLKREETGPLLEPLTPSSRLTSFKSATTAATSLPSSHPSNLYNHTSQALPSLTKTPIRTTSSNIQNIGSGLIGSTQSSHVLNFLRTPNARNTRTPNSNSIMKKFWNSPSFIEDFYTSPSIPRFSDDDHHKRLFGSPDKKPYLPNPQYQRHPLHSYNDKKSGYFDNSGNDLFGVDIFSVVQRAVESCKEDNRRKSLQETINESGSTDNESEANVTM